MTRKEKLYLRLGCLFLAVGLVITFSCGTLSFGRWGSRTERHSELAQVFEAEEQAIVEEMPEPEAVRDALNRHLPEDIAVLEAERVPERFHSRLNAVSKTYLYRIETAERADVFQRKYVYILGKPLDAGAMERAAFFLAGTHDFRGFSSLKRTRKSTVRTLALPELRTAGSGMELLFTGDGFLYHMVRIMAGTLIEAGLHERSAESVKEVLESKNRALAGFTAPPQGLFLADVRYSSDRV